jgi:hypothetical protein
MFAERLSVAVFLALSAAGVPWTAARAGEAEKLPEVVAVPTPGLVAIRPAGAAAGDPAKVQAERAAVDADLVAVVKVTEIAGPKDEAKDAKDGKEVVPNAVLLARGWQTVEKTISAEVVELLKGDKETKALKIVAQIRKIGNQEHLMVTVDRVMPGGGVARTTQSVPFNLAKDKETLVFLKLLREEKDEAGKVTGRVWSLLPPIPDGAAKETVDAARAALKKVADWEKAPELGADEAAAIDKLIKELGSDDFATREKASKALIDKGDVVRGKAREALKSPDAETAARAGTILEAITPAFLKKGDAANPSTGIQLFQGGAQIIQMEVRVGN